MTEYHYTDDRSGEAFFECDGCGRVWPEGLIKHGECIDCREENDE